MKKIVLGIFTLILAGVCIFVMTGCSDENRADNKPTKEAAQIIEEPLYVVDNTVFPDFSLSCESGRYLNSVNVTISGAQDCKIYYTLDGSAPLLDENEYYFTDNGSETNKLIIKGSEIKNNETIEMGYGFWMLRVMAVDKNNKVSGVLAKNYSVYADFDTTSDDVVSDSRYEYYINFGINRYDTLTQKSEIIKKHNSNEKITALNISTIATTFENEFGEKYPDQFDIPEIRLDGYQNRKSDFVEKNSLLYYASVYEEGAKTGAYEYMLGYKTDVKDYIFGNFAKRIGNSGWVQSTVHSDVLERTDENSLITIDKELAKWCTLLTSKYAIRNQNHTAVCDDDKNIKRDVVVRNIDGTNERVLFVSENEIYLDAVIKDKILYHYKGTDDKYVHMVYDIINGEHRENTFVKDKKILGYTPTAVYLPENGYRIPVDYDKL